LPAPADRTIIAAMRRSTTSYVGAAALAFAFAHFGRPAQAAAAEWIYRGLTLPRGEVAIDIGVGYGHDHDRTPADRAVDGWGLNLALAVGVTHELELGLRTGVRLDDGGQFTQADRYGRTFDTETYGTLNDRVANPELHLRWTVARGSAALIGLETRAYLPIEAHSRFGLMFAVPIALRLGSVRIDTGLYVPILFYDPTRSVVSIPVHLWIQATPTFWLGPLFGLQIYSPGGHDAYPLGFGFGSALAYNLDLRAWFLFPDLNQDEAGRTFGAGVGLQIRF
jgi:hypothetical protein